MLRIPRFLNLDLIYSADSMYIYSIYNALLKGASFDSIHQSINSGKNKAPVKLSFGQIKDEYAEDIIFSLEEGEFSSPIYSEGIRAIFKIISEGVNTRYDSSADHKRNAVYTLIKERRAKNISGAFVDKLVGGRSVTADKELFLTFTDTLYSIINERITQSSSETEGDIRLTETDLMRVRDKLDNDQLSSSFVKFEKDAPTMRDFLFYLIYQKIFFKSLEQKHFRSAMNAAVKVFIEDEILCREALRQELQKLPSIKNDLNVWRDFYLSEVLMQKYTKDIMIPESEIAAFREEAGKEGSSVLQVNIIEILMYDLREAENILNLVKEGKDFRELAGQYNRREWTKNSSGEWGYFPVSSGGEIGKLVSGMNIGEIYGPVKVPEGYSIFKLIDKKYTSTGIKDTVDTKLIRMQLSLKKMNDIINTKTTQLAEKYGISLNNDLLHKIEVSPLNTFTYRLIGFGGKIAALPITIPVYEWYKKGSKFKVQGSTL